MATQAPPLGPEIYAVFSGQIDQAGLQRIFSSLAIATNPASGIKHIHLLFQSLGGFVGDGVCLYNFFRTFPINLTLHNSGQVLSIATIAYLGAKKRKTSARATFMIHRTFNFPQSATAARLQAITESARIDDERTESILREHLSLSDEQWADLDRRELTFSGKEAVSIGLAHELGEFSPPKGVQIFNL